MFAKQLHAPSLHPILTDRQTDRQSSLPQAFQKAETNTGILFHRKHRKCTVLDLPNEKWLTNVQGKAFHQPSNKPSKSENRDLILLLKCKVTQSPDFRLTAPGVFILHWKPFQRAVPETHGHYHRGIWAITTTLCHLVSLCSCILLRRPLRSWFVINTQPSSQGSGELKRVFIMGHNIQEKKPQKQQRNPPSNNPKASLAAWLCGKAF